MDKNKPVLHKISTEEDITKIMLQGMEPAKMGVEAAMDNELKDEAKKRGKE